MSRTIDERIVEMRFDNAQFEKNVKTSMGTLAQLKESLKLEGATKGLDAVSAKASNGINLDNIARSIEVVEKRFSTLGIIGAEVIRKLTDAGMNFVGNVMGKVYNSIVGGGVARAKNIENAHFQLQGLLKDEAEVQKIMDQAMDSVDGTAYGYDVAAKAASMFASSGIKAGKDMETSLRALAGTTAMTGRDYESIAQIFTTISGQGRILGDQLNQFAASGVNVASTLADYYREVKGEVDMTEEGIRKLISDPKTNIYFEEFAEAMNWAFGDQAKKANETFNGSLANIKAALSRVGAKFVSPLIVQNGELVKLFNTIRLRINDINKQIDPFAKRFTSLVKNAALSLNAFLQNEDVTQRINETMPKLFRIFDDSIQLATYALKGFGTVLKPVIQGLQKFIPYDILDRIGNFTTSLRLTWVNMGISDETAKKLRQTFQGVSAVFHIAYQAISAVANGVLKPLSEKLGIVAGKGLDVTASIGQWLVKLDSTISKGDIFNKIINRISLEIHNLVAKFREFASTSTIFNAITTAVTSAVDVFKQFFKVVLIDPDFSGLIGLGARLKDTVINVITIPITIIKTLDSAMTKYVPSIAKFGHILKDMIMDLGKGLTEAFSGKGFKSLNDLINGGAIATISASLFLFINRIKKATSQAIPMFAKNGILGQNGIFGMFGLFGNIGPAVQRVLNQTSSAINQFTKSLKADMIEKIAKSLAILAAALLGLSLVNSEKLTASLGMVTVLLGELVGVIAILNKMMATSNPLKNGSIVDGLKGIMSSFSDSIKMQGQSMALSKILVAFAGSILILAGALKIISTIDNEKIVAAMTSITILITEMAAVSVVLTRFNGTSKLGAASLIGFAAAIVVLTNALKTISAIDANRLNDAMGVLTGLIIELSTVSVVLTRFNGTSKVGAAGLIGFAASIGILTLALTKIAEIQPDKLMGSLGALTVVIGELVTASILLSNFGKGLNSSAIGLIAFAGAIAIMSTVVEKFAAMKPEDAAKGLQILAVALAEFVVASLVLGKANHILSSAAALLIMAEALTIVGRVVTSLGSMSWEGIAKGLVAMGGALAEIAIALHFMKGTMGAAASLLVVAGALAIFGSTMKGLGSMSWEGIAKALIAIAGAFTVIGVAGALLAPLVPSIMSFAASVALLGVACLACGAGLALFASGMAALAVSGVTGAHAMVQVIETLLVDLTDVIYRQKITLVNAIKTLIEVIITAFVECVPELVDGLLEMITLVLESLDKYAPRIVVAAIDLVKGLISAIKERMPDIAGPIIEFFKGVLNKVKEGLKNLKLMDPKELLETIGIFALVTGLMVALGAMAALAPGAMVGVLAVGAVITEMAIVLAAIGAITNIPGLKEFVDKGGDMLQSIGIAIGKFIGGFIGGALSGLTSQLPEIANDLSKFMTNLEPFLNSASKINASAMDGVGALAKAIILITGAEVLQGLTSWLTGGNALTKFGQEIADFGPYFKEFADSISGIDPYVVTASAIAASALAEMASNLPNSGGLAAKIFGDNTLTQFGEELKAFAQPIADYAEIVKDVKPEAVEGSVKAAQLLADMAKTLPNSGGLAAKIFGDNTLTQFGEELKSFAGPIADYAEKVKDVNPEAVEGSVKAAQILSDMANTLPNSGGLTAKIFGDNTLSQFGEELKSFGPHIAQYSKDISDISPEAVSASASAMSMLVDVANQLGNHGGIITAIKGDNTLSQFGEELVNFAPKLVGYSAAVAKCDLVAMNSVITEIRKLAELSTEISGIDTSAFSNFSKSLTAMANTGIDRLIQAFDGSTVKVKTAISTLIDSGIIAIINEYESKINTSSTKAGETTGIGTTQGMTNKKQDILTTAQNICSELIKTFESKLQPNIFTKYGKENVMQSIITGILSNKPKLMTTCQTVCTETINKFKLGLPIQTFKLFGSNNIMKSIIDGIESKRRELLNKVESICRAVVEQFKKGLDSKKFTDMGKQVIEGICDGMKNAANSNILTSAINDVIAKVKTALTNATKKGEFEAVGKGMADGLAKGIKSGSAAAEKAMRELVAAVIKAGKDAAKEKSPSKETAVVGEFMSLGLAKGIDDGARTAIESAEETAYGAMDSMRATIRKISNMISSDMDLQPRITPVIDLTDVEDGSKRLRGMLNRGLNVSVSYSRALSAANSSMQLKATPEIVTPKETPVSTNYTFTQNNYSPKALSRKEIYRQTRNQFSAFKGAVSGI